MRFGSEPRLWAECLRARGVPDQSRVLRSEPAFRAVGGAGSGIAIGWMIEARHFITIHARHEDIIPGIIGWITGVVPHSVGQTPTAQVFASSSIGKVGGREVHGAVALFDHEAVDPAPA